MLANQLKKENLIINYIIFSLSHVINTHNIFIISSHSNLHFLISISISTRNFYLYNFFQ